MDAPKLLEVVTRFNDELVKKRGVPVRSYLVDDGWDDPDVGVQWPVTEPVLSEKDKKGLPLRELPAEKLFP